MRRNLFILLLLPLAANGQSLTDRSEVERMTAQWPNRPKLAAQQMMVKYGMPGEATPEQLIWHNAGPYKRITLMKKETPHDFPKPHMDFLQHTVNYTVPPGKSSALAAFDGSATFDRTAGELSARCDLEGHNILTLNLSNDLIKGRTDVAGARRSFSRIVVEDILGKHPPYVEALQFTPASTAAADPDRPTIAGSPMRPARAGMGEGADAEVLAFVIALDENEVLAGMEATIKKSAPQEVQMYGRMLHEQHGRSAAETMALGQRISVRPIETPAVDAFRVEAAGGLAKLVPLEGRDFGRSFLAAMIKGHGEALDMIDRRWMPMARSAAVKGLLTKKRGSVVMHLQEAQRLEGQLAAR